MCTYNTEYIFKVSVIYFCAPNPGGRRLYYVYMIKESLAANLYVCMYNNGRMLYATRLIYIKYINSMPSCYV